MKDLSCVLNGTEKTVYALRTLYTDYGFKKYRMSKFEEYDLYAKNKNYLLSENVITFTDTDGKLLALKPDVTLSIIKNGKDNLGVQKVFYDENIYRVSKGTNSFKEFMQVGLECFGDIKEYEIFESIVLALKSLKTISNDFILDLSNLDFVQAIIEDAKLSIDGAKKVMEFLSSKNEQGVISVCKKEGVSSENEKQLRSLVSVYGTPKQVLDKLKELNLNDKAKDLLISFESLVLDLCQTEFSQNIKIDFSAVSDVNYYNGIVFKGFISGVPTSIISGGQYDNLMQKMGRKDKAIGFAVYLDELEKLYFSNSSFDVDVLVLYQENAKKIDILKEIEKVINSGETALALSYIPEKLKFKKKIIVKGEN